MNDKKFNKIIRQAKHSRKALKVLYDHYYPLLVIHINRSFRGKLDGRDIAHQFFIKLFEIKVREYIRYPTSWVYTVADNIARQILKKNTSRNAAEVRGAIQDKTFDTYGSGTEIIRCLNDRAQKIMYLRYWEGYKLIEIAALLGMNYSTLKSAHKKAKSILKKVIKKEK